MNDKNSCGALALALLLGLAACGGGGASSAPAAPLVLLGSTPADGATDIARDIQPTATFNQTLDAASANGGSVQLLSLLGLPIAANVGASGAGLTIKPVAGALPGGTTYRFSLGGGLKSAAGGVLGTALASNFTTVAQQWGTATQINATPPGFNGVSDPAMVADAAGNVTVAWVQNINGTLTLNASRYSNGSWAAPVQVSAVGGSPPALAVDAGGNWSAPVQLDSPGATGDAVSPTLVADATDNVTAAWLQKGTNWNVIASRYSGGAWSSPVEVYAEAASSANQPSLTVDAAGNVSASWIQSNISKTTVNLSRYDGGGWSVHAMLNTAGSDVYRGVPVPLATDAAGNVTAIWREVVGGNLSVVSGNRFQ